jgi:hypothetical protein
MLCHVGIFVCDKGVETEMENLGRWDGGKDTVVCVERKETCISQPSVMTGPFVVLTKELRITVIP